jgi:hypothetical protein
MYNVQKEIFQNEADEYGTFGKPYYITNQMTDPVDCCLPGNFLNCPKTTDLGLCPMYMAQRCASQWDDKCTLYANSIEDEQKSKDFFRDTISKKFCKLDANSECSTSCQPFDPISQQSPLVCSDIGNEVLKNKLDSMDIGWYKPVNVSPDYMGKCKKNCDIQLPEDIPEDDVVINTCIRYGFCNDTLSNICSFSKSGGEFKNKNLGEFCKAMNSGDNRLLNARSPFIARSELNSNPISSTTTPPPSLKKDDNNWFSDKTVSLSIFLIIILVAYLIYDFLTEKKKVK